MTTKVLEVLGRSTGGIRRHVAVLGAGLEARGWAPTFVGPAGVLDGLRDDLVPAPIALGASAPKAIRTLRPQVADADVVHAHGLTAGWLA